MGHEEVVGAPVHTNREHQCRALCEGFPLYSVVRGAWTETEVLVAAAAFEEGEAATARAHAHPALLSQHGHVSNKGNPTMDRSLSLSLYDPYCVLCVPGYFIK